MKIATWNIERPHIDSKKNQAIIDCLKKVDADILILTETNECIKLEGTYNHFHSAELVEPFYLEGERRVSIFSKYNSTIHYETFRNDTSICEKFETPLGVLVVYGTVIGIYGNRGKDFIEDLDQQLLDFERIAQLENLCIAGDLNISFSDNYYFTKEGRQKLNSTFAKLKLINLTESILQNIDHIILSKEYVGDRDLRIETWNIDKKLSDHIGVAVEIIN